MIEGLKVIDLKVHGDARGWFKENWRAEWLDLSPVQHNLSFNADRGTTRGLHAEPWDKLVSVATGRVFGAWLDLREGSETFGQIHTEEIGPDKAVFVPRGVANGFQALEDNTAYSYLVSDYWSAEADYAETSYTHIDWPLEPINLSEKDRAASTELPMLPPRRVLITGANGQLGTALRAIAQPHWEFYGHEDFDICNPPALPWRQYSAIINAAAFNDVDGAELDATQAWRVNAAGPAALARIAAEHNLTLVHVSTDYVFDGTADSAYTEDSPLNPLSAYGASKAAGDIAAATAPRHYVVRTSWVAGQGNNFIASMLKLARQGRKIKVVDDQRGRITFANDLAAAIAHLLRVQPEYGTYNVSGGGDAVGRDEVAMACYIAAGQDPANVQPVSSQQYYGDQAHAPRPVNSELDTSKIEATGFKPQNWRVGLALYAHQGGH